MTLQETYLDCRRIAYLEVVSLKQVNCRANVYGWLFCTEGSGGLIRNVNGSEEEWQFTYTLISLVSIDIFCWKSV